MKLIYFSLIALISSSDSVNSLFINTSNPVATCGAGIKNTNTNTNHADTISYDPCVDSGDCDNCPHACRYWTDCWIHGLYCICASDTVSVDGLGHCVDAIYGSGCC